MEEDKKWIDGFEGLYWITSSGKVISEERLDRFNRRHGGEIKPLLSGGGYHFVNLYLNGKHYQRKIHRLVAEAFIPNPDNKREVDHIDNNKSNNDVSNLRWVTHKENQNNEITRAKMLVDTSKYVSQKGSDNPFSRRVKMYSLRGEYIRAFDSLAEAGAFVGVGAQQIGRVCSGKRFSSGGYLWAYDGAPKRAINCTPAHGASNKRPILQLSPDGELIAEYGSVQEAADSLGILACNIIHNAKGEGKTYKGYKWRYKK